MLNNPLKRKDVVQKLLMVWAQTDNPNPPLWFIGLKGCIQKLTALLAANVPDLYVQYSTRNSMPWVNLPSFWDYNHGHFQVTYLITTYQLGVASPKKHIWDYNHRFSKSKQTGQDQIDQ